MRQVGPATVTSAPELVDAARQRLASELATVSVESTAAGFERLRAALGSARISRGAIVHLIRAFRARGDEWAARDLFVLLLERCELANRAWVSRVMRQTPLAAAGAAEIGEELRQELALSLWVEIARSRREKWELFFAHALDYAQRHTATAYMERHGLWRRTGVVRGRADLARLLVSVSRLAPNEAEDSDAWLPSEPQNPFRAAELADLRSLVTRLPEREQAVIVMRYWQGASEDEIGQALGVTTRTIFNLRRSAYKRLRAWYLGEPSGDGAARGTADDE